jgi:hypothetical protein
VKTSNLTCFEYLRSVRRLLVTANVVPSSQILVTLMKALSSSETSVLARATRRNIPENGILHSHRRQKLQFCIALNDWALQRTRNVSPVRYELGFYIPEDGNLHSQRRENLKSWRSNLYKYRKVVSKLAFHS